MASIVARQRDARADPDLEDRAADSRGGLDRGPAALGEHWTEHQIVDRRPPRIGLQDRGVIETICHGATPAGSRDLTPNHCTRFSPQSTRCFDGSGAADEPASEDTGGV